MTTKNTLNRNNISVRDPALRMTVNNILKYIYAIEDRVVLLEEKIGKPIDFGHIERSVQSQFAQQHMQTNNLINSKIKEMETITNTLKKSSEDSNIKNIEQTVNSLVTILDKVEKTLISLWLKVATLEETINKPSKVVIKESINKSIGKEKKIIKTKKQPKKKSRK